MNFPRLPSDPRDPRTRLLFSGLGAVLVAGCLVFANLLASYVPVRLDLSQGGAWSLSPASKNLLKRLEDPLYVRAYFSRTLPTQYAANRDYASNLLKEYRQRSGGKLRLEFVDVENPEKKNEALREGVVQVRFNTIERERYEAREALLGLVLQYEDKKEVVPFVQDVRSLEYDLTSRIKRLTARGRKSVGFLLAAGARGPDGLPEGVQRALAAHYDLKPVDPSSLKPEELLPPVDALVLLGPTERLKPADVYRLDQFLLSGRPVAVGLDVKRSDLRSFMAQPLDAGLFDWLGARGIRPARTFVLDLQNQKLQVQAQQGWIQIMNIIDYPPFPVATGLAQEHPITKGLDAVTLPFVAALEVAPAPGLKAVALAESSPASWLKASWEKGGAALNPFETFTPAPEDKRGPFTLAAAVEGDFKSAFPQAPEGLKPASPRPQGTSRLVVVGTSHFADAQFPGPAANQAFALNLIDWLAQDDDLISIRAKAAAFRPLRPLPVPAKTAIKYANMFSPPFLAVGFGLLRWRRRRRMKAEAPRKYA